MKNTTRKVLLAVALVCLFNLATHSTALAQGGGPGHPGGPGGDPANHVFGQVTAIAGSTISLKTRDGSTQSVFTTADTKFERNHQAAKLSDFKVNDFVAAHGAKNSSGQFVADSVVGGDAHPPAGPGEHPPGSGHNAIVGDVVSVSTSAGTITVKAHDGSNQVIYTTSSTQFSRNHQAAKLSDFKAGDHVAAEGTRDSSGKFTATRVFGGDGKPSGQSVESVTKAAGVSGEISAVYIDAGVITVVTSDGQDLIVYVDNEAGLSRRGQTANLDDFGVGDHVDILGLSNDNGEFVADFVFANVLKKNKK
ncbi:MAG TPA: DUF5666 domain-containing protein [Blastocatellia bacterium]|nr:DUF5666 domain-containing protein [Blastocatellia bacterium]